MKAWGWVTAVCFLFLKYMNAPKGVGSKQALNTWAQLEFSELTFPSVNTLYSKAAWTKCKRRQWMSHTIMPDFIPDSWTQTAKPCLPWSVSTAFICIISRRHGKDGGKCQLLMLKYNFLALCYKSWTGVNDIVLIAREVNYPAWAIKTFLLIKPSLVSWPILTG